MNSKICCICITPPQSFSEKIVLCVSCSNYVHSSCYQISTSINFSSPDSFICIVCRLFLNNPFLQINDLIIKPYMLPLNQQFENLQKFQLNYPQTNDFRNNNKQLYFVAMQLNSSEFLFEWPMLNLFFWINNKQLDFEKKCYGIIPFNYLRNWNEFNVCCFENLTEPIIFLIFLARRQSTISIVQTISKRSVYGSLHIYRKKFEKMLLQKKKKIFRIIDVYSKKLINLPSKGRLCNHLECFELENYLKMNENEFLASNLKWKCPICQNIVLWNELDIDLYAKEILQEFEKKQKNCYIAEYVIFDEFNSWEVFEGDYIEEQEFKKILHVSALPEIKMKKLEKNQKAFDILIKFRSFFNDNAVNNNLPLHNINNFKDFYSLNDIEFYQVFRAMGLINNFHSKKNIKNFQKNGKRKSLKEIFEHTKNPNTATEIIVSLSFFWVKKMEDIVKISILIMCKNGKLFPDICLTLDFLIIFAKIIKENNLEERFEINSKEGFGAVFGILLSFLITEYNFDERKVGKILNLLWTNIEEFGFNETFNENNYLERIDEMSNLLVNFTNPWSHEKFIKFILELYQPPSDLKTEGYLLNLKFMVHYLMKILKKRCKNTISKIYIKEFIEKWDSNDVLKEMFA